MHHKPNVFNPDDPYYRRRVFKKQVAGVYPTEKVVGFIKPKNH